MRVSLKNLLAVAMLSGPGTLLGATNDTAVPLPSPSGSSPPAVQATPNAKTTLPDTLSFGAGEVLKLHQNGVPTDVIVSYVDHLQTRFELTADDIIYLRNAGVPTQVLGEMLRRDQQLQQQPEVAQQAPNTQVAPPSPESSYGPSDFGYPNYSYSSPNFYPNYAGWWGPSWGPNWWGPSGWWGGPSVFVGNFGFGFNRFNRFRDFDDFRFRKFHDFDDFRFHNGFHNNFRVHNGFNGNFHSGFNAVIRVDPRSGFHGPSTFHGMSGMHGGMSGMHGGMSGMHGGMSGMHGGMGGMHGGGGGHR